MPAELTIPEFISRSAALEASLRAVLSEYTLLHGQYENLRNEALPENNPVPGGAAEVNMNAADAVKNQIDRAFEGIMDIIQEICAINQGGGRRLRKRRGRKTRRNK